jgi:catechol 2,3-dioxygenase-like lactoylglutathione lyase family enzyme
MLDHVSLGVTNLERSRHFYDEALRPLGIVRTVDFDRGSDYGAMAGSLGVEFTITVEPSVTVSRGTHLCFRAPTLHSLPVLFGRFCTQSLRRIRPAWLS